MNLKYYWINIDRCKERREYMEQQFNENNVTNLRINASTPDSLNVDINDKPPYYCGNPFCLHNKCKDCIFEYSCVTSHLRAIKQGYEELTNDDEHFIVCEDDTCMPFKVDFKLLIENLPKDFEIFQMMACDKNASEMLYNNHYKNKEYYVKYDRKKEFWSTGMYLITKQGAKKLIDMFYDTNTNKFDLGRVNVIKQADILLYTCCTTYTTTMPLCIPNLKFISEIHPYHEGVHKQSTIKMCEIIKEGLIDYPYLLV